MEKWTNSAGTTYKIHGKKDCAGEHCAFHNPSSHHMVSWNKNIRTDVFKWPLVERICDDNGIGHPDPDSLAYLVAQDVAKGDSEEDAIARWGIHGCDGCCNPAKFNV